MIDDTEEIAIADAVAACVASRLRTAFYLGLSLGLMFGFWATLVGMALGWAMWLWWLA